MVAAWLVGKVQDLRYADGRGVRLNGSEELPGGIAGNFFDFTFVLISRIILA